MSRLPLWWLQHLHHQPVADRAPLDDVLAGRPGRLGPCRAGLAVQRDEAADSGDGGSVGTPLPRREP